MDGRIYWYCTLQRRGWWRAMRYSSWCHWITLINGSFVHPGVGLLELLKLAAIHQEMIRLPVAVVVYVEVDIAWTRE